MRSALAAGAGALLLATAGSALARPDSGSATLRWIAPTPAAGSSIVVGAGRRLSLSFAVSDPVSGAHAHVEPAVLPAGATFASVDGNPATATLTWTPTAADVGTHAIALTAADDQPVRQTAPELQLVVRVRPAVGTETMLSSGDTTTWAYVDRTGVARTAPSSRARPVARVSAWTPEAYPNLVDALRQRYTTSGWWVQVRLSTLPNGRLGWLPRRALASYRQVTTHVYVDRRALRLTLKRGGATVFTAPVGVGRAYWPTPRGEFYVREKITGFRNPMYGPIAFGTSARSSVLTDWPGGGFIGIHGTNEPGIIPGRVSHGCIRLRNAQILKLARLLPLGTPVTVS